MFLAYSIVPRLAVLLPAMASLFATIAAWSVTLEDRRRLAVLAIGARILAIGGALWLHAAGFTIDGPALAWLVVLGAAVAVELVGWAWLAARPAGTGLAVATGAGAGVLLAAVVVREAPRIALLEPVHPLGAGWLAFVCALVLGCVAIAWIVRTCAPARTR